MLLATWVSKFHTQDWGGASERCGLWLWFRAFWPQCLNGNGISLALSATVSWGITCLWCLSHLFVDFHVSETAYALGCTQQRMTFNLLSSCFCLPLQHYSVTMPKLQDAGDQIQVFMHTRPFGHKHIYLLRSSWKQTAPVELRQCND